MVLHNDKWKYKAKRNVERKHAQQQKKKNLTKVNEEKIDESESSNSQGEDTDEEELDEEEKKFRNGERRTNVSNSWRFEDPVVDESILKDPEYIAQLNAIKQEEEDRSSYMRQVVSDRLKDEDDMDKPLDVRVARKQITSLKKMTGDDLENLKFDSDSEEEVESSGKPEIREFTAEEHANFLKLQERIKHQKEMDKIRTRMDKINNKLPVQKARVLELNSKIGADNYRGIVDERLNNTHGKVDTKTLNDLVCQMNGIDLKTDEAKPKSAKHFDLDDLLKSSSVPAAKETSTKDTTSTPIVLDDSELDDFLDSVL